MVYTARAKAAVASGSAVAAAGFAVILGSTWKGSAAGSVGGTCLVMTALTVITLILIRNWVKDNREERRALALASQQAAEEHTRYIALQAALEGERGRLTRDFAAESARLKARLTAEREAMEAQFEEQRAQLAGKAFRMGVEMERSGRLKPEQEVVGNLIRFPERAPEQERSREHGVVGP